MPFRLARLSAGLRPYFRFLYHFGFEIVCDP
jgi:hypothetical protein